jgi:hypothetical protein
MQLGKAISLTELSICLTEATCVLIAVIYAILFCCEDNSLSCVLN